MMMNMLNRYTLNEKINFVYETTWYAHRFSCRDCSAEQCKIFKSTSNLTVEFQSDSLLMNDEFSIAWTRLKFLKDYIFSERTKRYQKDRAFHYFSMKMKEKRGTLDNKMTQDQNLNTVSQTLFNIYCCMKKINELNLFFEEIRIFFAVATVENFWLRVHRDVKVNERQHNNKDYSIGFKFDDVIDLRKEYFRSRVSDIIHNVLCRYEVETLHSIMRKIVKILLDRASIEGTQLSQNNISSVSIDSSPLAALNITRASQASTKRKKES